VPVMALLLVLGPLLLPEFRDPGAGRLDLLSAALSVAAVLAVIYGLKQVTRDGLGWLPAVSIVAGLAAGTVFVRRQHRLADPLLDLRLFRSAAFTTALTQLAQLLRRVRHPAVHHPVPAAGAGPVAAGGGPVDAAVLGRVRRRVPADPGAGAAVPPGLRHGDQPDAGSGRPGVVHPGGQHGRVGPPGDRVGGVLAGPGAGGHPDHRPGRRVGAAGASRG